MQNEIKKIESEINTTRSKIAFARKFLKKAILNHVENLIDFENYLAIKK